MELHLVRIYKLDKKKRKRKKKNEKEKKWKTGHNKQNVDIRWYSLKAYIKSSVLHLLRFSLSFREWIHGSMDPWIMGLLGSISLWQMNFYQFFMFSKSFQFDENWQKFKIKKHEATTSKWASFFFVFVCLLAWSFIIFAEFEIGNICVVDSTIRIFHNWCE